MAEPPLARVGETEDIDVIWLPFELNPEPEPQRPYDRERMRATWEQNLLPMAKSLGVEMNPPAKRMRTRLAHEAYRFAETLGFGDAMHHALFEAVFVQGRDIGDPVELGRVGAEVGLHAEDLESALKAGTFRQEVVEREQSVMGIGVTAVPSYIIGRYLVPGLLQTENLMEVLAKAREQVDADENDR